MTKTSLKPLSEIIADLPDAVSRRRFMQEYQAAIRDGFIQAVPIPDSFQIGRHTHKDDLVRLDDSYATWQAKTVRTLELGKARHGVVAHADQVISGEVNFDELARKYRDQLNQRSNARQAVKKNRPKPKRAKPKLVEVTDNEQVNHHPRAITKPSAKQAEQTSTGEGAAD